MNQPQNLDVPKLIFCSGGTCVKRQLFSIAYFLKLLMNLTFPLFDNISPGQCLHCGRWVTTQVSKMCPTALHIVHVCKQTLKWPPNLINIHNLHAYLGSHFDGRHLQSKNISNILIKHHNNKRCDRWGTEKLSPKNRSIFRILKNPVISSCSKYFFREPPLTTVFFHQYFRCF